MDEKLHKKLNDRREKGTLRSLSSFDGMIDFASNDYLGFSKCSIKENGTVDRGATGSRLISGNSARIETIEADLAEFFNSESGLCFNSGYDANLGVFSSVPQRGDVVLYDEFVHASVRDGIRLSNAKAYSFMHNNLNDLHRLLELNKSSTIYIAIEALYSMHGDLCPLGDIIRMANKFNASVILDEAHSSGVFGAQGRGFAHALNLESNCLIRLVTFGKAYGAHGAVVLCSNDLREYLVNFARSFIYSTALPESAYERMKVAMNSKEVDHQRFILQENLVRFRELAGSLDLISAPNSPIQFIRFQNLTTLKRVERTLHENGIFSKAIYTPTVSEGDEGLRISMHSYNLATEIERLISILSQERDIFESDNKSIV